MARVALQTKHGGHKWLDDEEMKEIEAKYTHPLAKTMKLELSNWMYIREKFLQNSSGVRARQLHFSDISINFRRPYPER